MGKTWISSVLLPIFTQNLLLCSMNWWISTASNTIRCMTIVHLFFYRKFRCNVYCQWPFMWFTAISSSHPANNRIFCVFVIFCAYLQFFSHSWAHSQYVKCRCNYKFSPLDFAKCGLWKQFWFKIGYQSFCCYSNFLLKDIKIKLLLLANIALLWCSQIGVNLYSVSVQYS